ncbi:hypothetical protein [Natronolimnobius sp. AArcel1]|nr:hypothetical protein [Natronolimnobius sp. AArcel1]
MVGSHSHCRRTDQPIAHLLTAIRTRLETNLTCRAKRVSTYSGP